jgi:HK97 family phage major capsid protein
LATVVETRRDAVEFLLDKDEAGAEWIAEAAARGETTSPRLAKLRIGVYELHAQIKCTQQLLDDADFTVESWLAGKAADKFARTESTAFVFGNGVGQPRGLLDYATASTDDDARAWGTVQYIASGAAAGFPTLGSGADNPAALFNMIYSLKAAYRADAHWLMNKATVNLVRKMRDSGGQFLWQAGLEAGQPDRLLGYPIAEAEDVPDVAANALAMAFGNFKVAYTVVDRIGQRVLRDPFTAKPFVLFDFTKRVGGDVVNTEAYKVLKIAVS